MSYLSEVLADNPIFLFRCDDDTGSTIMPDASGNDFHGTYFPSAIFGVASPIETDPASKAIRAAVGKLTTASAPDSDIRSVFTWEGWGYNHSDLLAGTGTVLCRSSQWGLSSVNAIGFNGTNSLEASLYVNSTQYRLTYPVLPNTWYYIAVSRNGNVMRLYVNGVLRAQRTDLDPGDLTVGGSDGWYVGRPESTSFWDGGGTDEVALYDTALSAGRILAHYEAALATLPLRATVVINVSVELNTDQITPVDFGFSHNFSQTFGSGETPIVEELEYRTNVNQSEPDYQQRISARPHGPLRTLEYHISPTAGAARARFQGSIWTPGQFYLAPVWNDAGVLTGTATSGTNTLTLDTTKRDYEIGSYVGICSDTLNPQSFQFFQITAITDTELTLDQNISTTVASGSPVFPARVASLSDDAFAVHSFAADHEDVTLRFELIESELSTQRITTYTPSTTYKSIEVFTLETAKVPHLNERPYDITRRIQARGRDYQFAIDTGSPQVFPVRFLLTSVAARSEFYGWLDARRGKLNPLFVSSKEKDYVATARPTSQTLTVNKTGFSLHESRRHLEILKTDSSFVRVMLTGITDNGNGTETLQISTGSFPVVADISRISFLKFCTLASDTIKIQHYKGNVSECGLSFRELLTSPS